MEAVLVANGVNALPCFCTQCGLIVLLAGKGKHARNDGVVRVPRPAGGDGGTQQLQWDTPEAYFLVSSQFDFENVCYTRDSKNLPGGMRVLTCAGCERGVLGVATPTGEGPDIKMTSYLLADRVSWTEPSTTPQ